MQAVGTVRMYMYDQLKDTVPMSHIVLVQSLPLNKIFQNYLIPKLLLSTKGDKR